MSDIPDERALLAAAPVWVGLPHEPSTSLAALPCLLPSFPSRRGLAGQE
ncbi:MAG: hypothetical protein ACLQD8_01245 [Thermoplasmata archaeon]